MTLDHDGVAGLLGAYALDAVDDDEARIIEAHLEGCDDCRAELEGHRAAVGWIAGSDDDARQRVWSQVADATVGAPIAPLAGAFDRRKPRTIRLTAIAAVAVLVVATAALIDAGHRRQLRRVDDDLALARSAIEVFSDPQAQRVQLRSDDGRIALQAAVRPDGQGAVIADALPVLGQDRTYQLWVITTSGPVSSGILGPRPGIERITIVDRRASALAVTAERAGGANTPTLPTVVAGPVPPA